MGKGDPKKLFPIIESEGRLLAPPFAFAVVGLPLIQRELPRKTTPTSRLEIFLFQQTDDKNYFAW